MTLSKIEWTDRSDWNPIRGCTRVSPGCGGPGPHGGCYAEAMAARFSDPGQWGHTFAERTPAGGRWTGKVELQEDRVTLPLRWAKGVPGRNKCFITSTSDPFHEGISDIEIDLLFAVMALRPDWIFQVLTKRSQRMREYLLHRQSSKFRWEAALDAVRTNQSPFQLGDALEWLSRRGPLPNVWQGVSCEDQQRWDECTADLKATPAAVRWVSAEPLLGPIETGFGWVHHHPDNDRSNPALAQLVRAARRNLDPGAIDWVVVGGESGPRARPMPADWARSLHDQCANAGVAFFFKQWGSNPIDVCKSPRIGKGGNLLDGALHAEFPG